MSTTTSKWRRIRAEINVTPLVDVVLVLLIIFMLVTPLLDREVPLPLTDNPEKRPEGGSPVVVVVNGSHDIWVNGDRTTEAGLPGKLAETFGRDPGGTVAIKADRRLTYGDVKRAVLTVREAGYQRIGLISEKNEKSAS